jgi:integrase
LKERRKRRKLTQGYADKNKKVCEHTLIPYFGKLRLDQITGELIDKWLDNMIAEKYENSTINGYFGTMQTMYKWAAKKRIIERDPFLDVQRLINEQKDKQIITYDEFQALFVDDWKKVWNNDLLLCTANKLAALTGIRISEILALRGEYVFDTHIYSCAQHDKYGYRETKDKGKKNIPLTSEVINDLRKLMKINGNGYLFSLSGGDKPVTIRHIYNGLRRALRNIGISDDDIKNRGLNVHAWRHFCNTELLNGGVPLVKVQAITRHKSKRMTDRYTHFNPLDFSEVTQVQANLLKKKTPVNDTAENDRPALTLVKTPQEGKAFRRRKAS